MPEVKRAGNGWNGTFLPGDESLGFADMLEMLADAVEKESISKETLSAALRANAKPFRECYMREQPRYQPVECPHECPHCKT